MLVFDITDKAFYFYDGINWIRIKNHKIAEILTLDNNVVSFTNSVNDKITVDLSNLNLSGEIQGKINNAIITNGVITSEKIKDGTIESIDIKDRTITNSKIVMNSITAEEIASDAIDSDEIKANAVGNDEIKNNSITSEKLSPNSIPSQGVLGINQDGELIWKEASSSAEWNILADQKGVTNAIDANYGIAINANEFPLRAFHVNDTMRVSHADSSAVLEFQSKDNNLFSIEQDTLGDFSILKDNKEKYITFYKSGEIQSFKNLKLVNNSNLIIGSDISLNANGSINSTNINNTGTSTFNNTLSIIDNLNVDYPTHLFIKNGNETNGWRIYNSGSDGSLTFNHNEDNNFEISFTSDGQIRIQDTQNVDNPTHIFLKNQKSSVGWRIYQSATTNEEGLYFNNAKNTKMEFGITDNGKILCDSIITKNLEINDIACNLITSNSSEVSFNMPVKFTNLGDDDNPTNIYLLHKDQTAGWRIYQSNENGNIYFNHNGDGVYEVGFTDEGVVNGASFSEVSDKRIKENISPINNALNKIGKINFVKYNKVNIKNKEYGVIAQDLKKILPMAVNIGYGTIYDKNGNSKKVEDFHSVNYRMVSILGLKALQELKIEKDKEISELKKQIKILKENKVQEFANLKNDIEFIKNENKKLRNLLKNFSEQIKEK